MMISMIISTYMQTDCLLCLLFSLRCQTHKDWEALVVHDGPNEDIQKIVEAMEDSRIKWVPTPNRQQDYGHRWKQLGIDKAIGDYICFTNGDNYYAPLYFKFMLAKLRERNYDVVYCNMVHSHNDYTPFETRAGHNYIDLGCFIAKATLIRKVKWEYYAYNADGVYFEKLKEHTEKIAKVEGYYFVHN